MDGTYGTWLWKPGTDIRQSCDQRTRVTTKDAPFSTQLSSVGTMVKVVNGKVQCRLCSKYPSCRWSLVCVAARGESKVNVMGGPADLPSLLSDHPLRTSEYRLNLARPRETDRRHCQENRSPVFSYVRSPMCGAALSFAIMLQCMPVMLRLIGYSCVIITVRQLAHFSTNLVRLKFPYENRLKEISRESYDNLICERCPNCLHRF